MPLGDRNSISRLMMWLNEQRTRGNVCPENFLRCFTIFAAALMFVTHVDLRGTYAQDTQHLWVQYEELRPVLTVAKHPHEILAYARECSTLVVSARKAYENKKIKNEKETSEFVGVVLFVTAKIYNARLAVGDTTGALRILGLALPFTLRACPYDSSPRNLLREFAELAIGHGLDENLCERLLGVSLGRLRNDCQGTSDLINLLERWFHFLSTNDCTALVEWFRAAVLDTSGTVVKQKYQSLHSHVFHRMIQLARARSRNGVTKSASHLYKCAFELAPDLNVAAGVCLEAGTRFAQQRQSRSEAYMWLEKAFRLSLELRDTTKAKIALKDAFVVALAAKDWKKAAELGTRYFESVGQRVQGEDGKVLTNTMLVCLRTFNYSLIESCYPLVLDWAKSSADSQTIVSLADIAVNYAVRTDRVEEATDWLRRLLSSRVVRQDARLQIAILLERVQLLLQQNRTLEAEALVSGLLATQSGLRESERARLYLAKGNISFQLGHLQTALNAYEAALSMSVEHPSLRTAIISNFAYVLGLLGQYSRALELCQETLQDTEIATSPSQVLDLLSTEAIVYSLKGETEIARKLERKCLELSLDVGDSVAYVQNLLNLAASSQRMSRGRQVDSLYSRIVQTALTLGDVQTAAVALVNQAVLRMTKGDLEKSDSLFTIAISYIDELAPDLRWHVFYELALLRRSQKRLDEAVNLLRRAVSIIESLGTPLSKEEYKLGFVSQRYQVYAELVGVLVSRVRDDSSSLYEAFAIAEHSKARVLVELFGRTWPEFAKSLEFDDSVRSRVLEGQRLVSLLTQELPENSWFVEFVVAPSSSYAFVLSPDVPGLRVVSIPVTENWLNGHVKLLYQLSAMPVDNTEENALQYFRVARSLYQTLLSRVFPENTTGGRALVIPDGVLFYLPFDALCTRIDNVVLDFAKLPYAVRTWEFIYAPSARAYMALKGKKLVTDSCLVSVFANPDFGGHPDSISGETQQFYSPGKSGYDGRWQPLPYTELEADLITTAVGKRWVRSFTGRDACESRFKQEATRVRPTILHVASHGIADNRTPKRSGIVLGRCGISDDGFVSVGELSSLRIASELTVLSCCQTALGKLYRGEGVDGLARAFLLAGSKAVLVTLWSIADRPSAEFMGYFYEKMFQEKHDPLNSLAGAKREWLEVSAYSHPFFWAAFQMIGFVPSSELCH